MPPLAIAEGVYWVGAVDWKMRDFHTYIVPQGTTYNSYLILDEKPALVELVHASFSHVLLSNIQQVIDPAQLAYVIVNHSEPDHAGALPEVLRLAPNARIIATGTGARWLGQNCSCAERLQTVKTGDTLTLGRQHLRFLEAPMLHWPDVMFTYLEGERVLFTSDAFCQHLATTERFVDQVGTEVAVELAGHFFANIVQPYSQQVLRVLAAMGEGGIAPRMLCPSHGLIWRDPQPVLRAYRDWAEAKTAEKAVIAYETMWGSTEQMAMAVLEGITSLGVAAKAMSLRVDPYSAVVGELLEARALLVGSPAMNRGIFPPVAGFLAYLKGLRPRRRLAAAFGSSGWGGGAVAAISQELAGMGFELAHSGIEIQFRPGPDELRACFDMGRQIALKVKEKAPQAAEVRAETKVKVAKWECTVCGYIHIGAEPPEVCPMCGAPKSDFKRIEG